MEAIERLNNPRVKMRGGNFGIWYFKMMVSLFGLRGTYGFLYIVCLYYVIFDRNAVSSAMPYVKRRFNGSGPLKRYWNIYMLFISQGKQLIDRYACISGRVDFDTSSRGMDEFVSLVNSSEKGVVLLTSHVGNWQIAMTMLAKLKKTVHLLMKPEENPVIKDSLDVTGDRGNMKVISPDGHLGGVVEIMNALHKGDIVAIMGDRGYDSSLTDVLFLGEKAHFPLSAFTIAAGASCPLVVLLSKKESVRKYNVDVSNVLEPVYNGRKNKREQLKKWVQEYALILEGFSEENPYQCFMFSDLWKKTNNKTRILQ